jgi:hypothetical protein
MKGRYDATVDDATWFRRPVNLSTEYSSTEYSSTDYSSNQIFVDPNIRRPYEYNDYLST